MPTREINVQQIVTLRAGGYCIVWSEPDAVGNHNTFTWNPTAWIDGYRAGVLSLEELQRTITDPNRQQGTA